MHETKREDNINRAEPPWARQSTESRHRWPSVT